MVLERFTLTDFAGNFLVSPCLPRLSLQAVELRLKLALEVLQTLKIAFGALQSQLRLMAPAVQTGDACSIFKYAAAFLRLGVDDFADTSLANQGRRTGACCRVLEQQPHVAGAHILAIDAEYGTGLALDAAGNLQLVDFVEFRRGLALGIVNEDADFGHVAGRAALSAGEDHIVHRRATHALVRGFSHRPA